MNEVDKLKAQSTFEQFDAQILLFARSYLELVERQTDAHVKDTLGRVLQTFSGLYQTVREAKDVGTFKKMTMMPKLASALLDLETQMKNADELVERAPHRIVGLHELDALCCNHQTVLQDMMNRMKN